MSNTAKTINKKYTTISPKELTAWWRILIFRASASFCFIWFKLFHKLKIHGYENIPKNLRTYIVAANHTSNFDPFIVGGTLYCGRKPVAFMAKRELFAHPLSGWYFNAVGAFAVNREKLEVSTVKTALTILKHSDWALGLFPEGTRKHENTGTGTVSEAKKGVAFFAAAGNVPILPIAIARLGPDNNVVHVYIGEMIPPPEGKELEQTTAALEAALAGLLATARTEYEKSR